MVRLHVPTDEASQAYLAGHDFGKPRRVFERELDCLLVDSPVLVRFKAVIVYIGDARAIVCRVEKGEWVSGVTATWVIRRG
jgi:hypothetical protein